MARNKEIERLRALVCKKPAKPKRPPRPPASARYVTDKEPAVEFTWADFVEANREMAHPEDLVDVAALKKGQSVMLGGRAWGTITITRTR